MKILIAGDFCPQNRVTNLIEEGRYNEVFGEVMLYTKQADVSIVNLEAPVVEHEAKGIDKCGPCLRGTSKSVDAIKYAGFNVATLANNHFYDYGEVGVAETLQVCSERGIATIGGGKNLQEASQTAYFEVCGKILAIINCCEHEFSIATDTIGGANPLNPIQQYYAIQQARQKADYVLVIIHGGHEHYQLPSPRMQETYRFFVDAGADAVVNHHQHCYSGYEIYQGKPIFYGIGNFLFDWEGERNSIWNEGYMVELSFEENLSFKLIPYVQCNEKPTIEPMCGEKFKEFESRLTKINEVIADDEKLRLKHGEWIEAQERIFRVLLCPYNNRFLASAWHRGWLKKIISKGKIARWLNYIDCESHRDILRVFLYKHLQ